jgi:AbrB family looped-hinge helix DNA binding protein
MNIIKVGRRGQVSIPSAIRKQMNLQEGDRVAFIQRGDEVVLQPLQQSLSDFRGSVPVAEPQDFDVIRQEVFDRRAYRTEAE